MALHKGQKVLGARKRERRGGQRDAQQHRHVPKERDREWAREPQFVFSSSSSKCVGARCDRRRFILNSFHPLHHTTGCPPPWKPLATSTRTG